MGYSKIPPESSGGTGPVEGNEIKSTGYGAGAYLQSDGSDGADWVEVIPPPEPLNSGDFSTTWGLGVGSAPIHYGNIVNSTLTFLIIPAMSGTANASTALISNASIIVQARPASVVTGFASVSVDNGTTYTAGLVTIGTNGVVTIYSGPNGETFVNGQNFIVRQTCVAYFGGL